MQMSAVVPLSCPRLGCEGGATGPAERQPHPRANHRPPGHDATAVRPRATPPASHASGRRASIVGRLLSIGPSAAGHALGTCSSPAHARCCILACSHSLQHEPAPPARCLDTPAPTAAPSLLSAARTRSAAPACSAAGPGLARRSRPLSRARRVETAPISLGTGGTPQAALPRAGVALIRLPAYIVLSIHTHTWPTTTTPATAPRARRSPTL